MFKYSLKITIHTHQQELTIDIQSYIIWFDMNYAYLMTYAGYSESKYRLRISLAHPRDCHFAHVQWLPLSIEKPQMSFSEIRFVFMFVPVR